MNSDSHDQQDPRAGRNNKPGIRTLSDARTWLAKLAENGAAQVQIKEPYRVIGGGLVAISASLLREDGARVNIEVYCYENREPAPIKSDLFPFPSAAFLPGAN